MNDGRSVFFLRHGRTAWNVEKRIQGRTDTDILPEAAIALGQSALPTHLRSASWFVSPLQRAQQTAAALGAVQPCLVDELIEMDWGTWEGEKLADLRRAGGGSMRENEARGLDFRPTGGESPRDVATRVRRWLIELDSDQPTVVVTHKGVMRAIFALAWGWDMRDSPPYKLDWTRLQELVVGADGRLEGGELNVALTHKALAQTAATQQGPNDGSSSARAVNRSGRQE